MTYLDKIIQIIPNAEHDKSRASLRPSALAALGRSARARRYVHAAARRVFTTAAHGRPPAGQCMPSRVSGTLLRALLDCPSGVYRHLVTGNCLARITRASARTDSVRQCARSDRPSVPPYGSSASLPERISPRDFRTSGEYTLRLCLYINITLTGDGRNPDFLERQGIPDSGFSDLDISRQSGFA